MVRRTDRAATEAASAASEAARTLAARSHEARAERTEPAAEPEPKAEPRVTQQADPDRVEKLLKNRPHDQAMDEIVAKREPKEEPPAEEPKAEPKAEAPKEDPKAEPAPEPVVEAPQPEAPKTTRVKVDGEEFDAHNDEIESYGGVKAYQIAKAHEKRLKSANETVAESKRLTAQLVEMLAQRKEPEKPQVSDDEFIKSKMDTVRFGTQEEAAGALREILQRGAPKPVDQNALLGQVLSAVDRKSAVADFGKEFPEVVANPLLVKLAVSLEVEEIAKAQKTGQPVDWRNVYRTIGNQIRGVVPRGHHQSATTASQTPSPTSSVSEKEARKASITNLPTSSARAAPPKEETELTPEQERKAWIAEQKKARGLG